MGCDCIEIITDNCFFMDFMKVNIKISCNDDVIVSSFKLWKHSCEFINKLSVVFVNVYIYYPILFLAHTLSS